MAKQLTNDLTDLYDFRVRTSDGRNTAQKINRYQAAKYITTLHKAGYENSDIFAEKRVNGKWQHDEQTFTLNERQEKDAREKNNGHSTSAPKTVTLKTALNNLSRVCLIAARTDTVTAAHVDAVNEHMKIVHEMLLGQELTSEELGVEEENVEEDV